MEELVLFNPYSANSFYPENVLLFTPAACIQVQFRLDCFMEANHMNSDKTAPIAV